MATPEKRVRSISETTNSTVGSTAQEQIMSRQFKRRSVVASLIFGLVSSLGLFADSSRGAEPAAGAEAAAEVRVLFVGNSLTYVNNLPAMLAELAKAGDQRPLVSQSETPGGCTLEKHWNDRKALTKIQSSHWDFVVLQEHSEPLERRDSMFEYGRKFDAEIRKQGAKTILYMTWALQNEPEKQPKISAEHEELAKELKARVAPVGNAWESALASDKNLVLHQKDKKHPTKTGTYLAACVFYATIYGKSPEGLPGRIGGLTDDEARPLQVIAWKSVQAEEK